MRKVEGKEEKKEEVVCPVRLEWLKAMYEILPLEIFRRSKLAPYEKCLKKVEE